MFGMVLMCMYVTLISLAFDALLLELCTAPRKLPKGCELEGGFLL